MKSEEDEAFDELARKQGAWGGGFKAKQAMAADKYSDIVSDGGLDPRNKMDAQPAQEPVECLDCGSHNVGIPATYDSLVDSVKAQPAQEDSCFCHDGASLQMVSGGAAPEGYLGKVTLLIDGEYIDYVKAQPAQEPSATRPCRSCNGTGDRDTGIPESPIATCKPCNGTGQIDLAQPPQRTWVGLTDEDKTKLAKAQHSWEDLCLAVEAKLKEKNNGT